ncbi:MAG: glycosyltransferase family 2 protein [Elusimicrobia bacterium]|nr:glycosyltransferase family 2 protein [Elusimicrobiota bacterium]
MAKEKNVSVIIPVHNAPAELKACLASLEATARGAYELILVDNASGPETRRYLASVKNAVKLRNASNLGFAKAVNQGLKRAAGRYLAVVNSDIVFFQGGLQGLAACLDADARAGACGPLTNRTVGVQRVVLAPKTEKDPGGLRLFAQAMALKFPAEAFEVHRLVGFCFMLRRAAYESIGLLDERFGVGCFEDLDYSLRLRQAGWTLKVAKDVFVAHRDHSSFKGHEHFHSWAVRNREVFVDKWCRKALEFLDELDPYLETDGRRLKKGR